MTSYVRVTTVVCSLILGLGTLADARSVNVRQTLTATGADPNAAGEGRLSIKGRPSGLSGSLEIRTRRLDPETTYQIAIDGVVIGTIGTGGAGGGRVRFNTRPHGHDRLLGVDPRGRTVDVIDPNGVVVLTTTLPTTGQSGSGSTRCCVPDGGGDGPDECEDRSPAECAAEGGIDMGAGSCLPNPCAASTSPGEGDIRCCLPDGVGDGAPECEDRTAAECSAQGGINIGAGSCDPNPCAPIAPGPNDDIRCCLPDNGGDGAPECEDRTAIECDAQGGIDIGAGVCAPDSCTGIVTPPGGGTPTVRVTCERRSDRSKISVDGTGLASGNYSARATSGANTATNGPAAAVGDEAEFDFDSHTELGATLIAASFIQGNPPTVTGEILDAGGAVIASATATCEDRQ